MSSRSISNKTRRLCIYFFYDKDGIVDDYVVYYLQSMQEFFSEICVVVNGFLTEEARKKIESVCQRLIIRENKGFDSWAYKEALESYGFEYIANNFEEVLLNNFTCFGPVGSFAPMFKKMGKSVCDFWGHCRYYPHKGQKVKNIPIPEHLMSYFILFRKNILKSKFWSEYWHTLQPINDYDDARLNHEFRLTPYFEKLGFISDSYMNCERAYKIKTNGSVFDAYYQLVKEKSPLLKRKVFFSKNGKYCFYVLFSRYNKILYYIKLHNLYDLKLIFSNLIRTGNFTFSKNKLTFRRKLKYFILGKIFNIKTYNNKIAQYPDFKFIKKIIE